MRCLLGCLIIAFLLPFKFLQAQKGFFPIQNFGPKQYGMYSSSNWCIAQDSLGMMYFGNANGLLQYDGNLWNFIPIKYGTYVRTLQTDKNGRVYIGCYGEFGYLHIDSKGCITYRSISSVLQKIDEKFKDIIKIHCVGDEVFFQSEERIYVYKEGSGLRTIIPETSFHTSFKVKDNLFVRQRNLGLFRLHQDKLHFLKGSENFADVGIFSMFEFEKEQILIATQETGIYLFNNSINNPEFEKFQLDDNSFEKRAKIYGGLKLNDGSYALNSLTSGVLFFDKNGKTTSFINKQMGLVDDDVKEIFQDKQKNLWITTNNGISMLTWNSPLSYYSADMGLEGSVHDLFKKNDRLYIATSNGLFFFDLKPNSKFQRIKNTSRNQFWEIRFENNQLIASGIDGVYLIKDTEAERVYDKRCRSVVFDLENKVWLIGGEDGLAVMEEDWKFVKQVNELNIVIIKIRKELESKANKYWISSLQYGLSLLELDIFLGAKLDYLGFPAGAESEYIYPFEYKHQVIFGTTLGLFRYDPSGSDKKRLVPFKLSSEEKTLTNFSEFKEQGQRIWMINNNRIQLFYQEQNELQYTQFLPINKGQLYCVFPDEDNTWIGAHEGLIKYEYTGKKNYKEQYQLLIRSIKTKNDSILFAGNQKNVGKVPPLSYTFNSIYFEFAALFFEESDRNLYSTYLEGYDKEWSTWSTENKISYPNLPEGNYCFKVKARNIFEAESEVTEFYFVIRPPWFRTWWARIGYGLVVVFLIWSFSRWRTSKLLQRQRVLETEVDFATQEIRKQKDQIEKEKIKSDDLLLNILPEEVAEELKEKGYSDAQLIDQVTVLFTDFKGFTAMSEQVSPKELVKDLHNCFSAFDSICEKYGIEKIKTIGDAYMAAGGLPSPNKTHAQDVVKAALEMAQIVENGKAVKQINNQPFFEIRIGAHTGPVVAGIVGIKKFQYDIWGDSVNTASRMESSGAIGRVNISQATYDLLRENPEFSFESRGKIAAKGKSEMEMYFVSLNSSKE